ncbi:hypothetical protein Hanom_Chr15g01388671 [Helianthus anomalus]
MFGRNRSKTSGEGSSSRASSGGAGFRTISITQRFEELRWERVLDWCEDITSRVNLVAICEWLSTLRFENSNGPAPTW